MEVTYGKRDADGRLLETLIKDSEGKHRMRMRLRDIRRVETFRIKCLRFACLRVLKIALWATIVPVDLRQNWRHSG